MSIKQTSKGWVARVQWRDPKTGKKRSLERLCATKADARRAESELEQKAGGGGKRTQQTLRDYSRSWIAARAPRLKPSVSRKYATSLGLHILPVLGDYRLEKLEPSDVRAYVQKRTDAGAAGNTVLNELRLLRTIARDSVADGLATVRWAEGVRPPAVRRYSEDDPNLLLAGELRAMLASVPKRWLPIVTMIAFTGLRWGEASALRWDDLDLERGLVRIRRTNWRGRPVSPKTVASARTVPLPAQLVAIFSAVPKWRRTGWLFPARGGELHRGTPLRAVVDRACAAAGVRRITVHGLRRTYNNLARQLAAREVVKSITGHATDAMLEHYSIVGDHEKKRLTEAVIEAVETSAIDPDGAGAERGGDE